MLSEPGLVTTISGKPSLSRSVAAIPPPSAGLAKEMFKLKVPNIPALTNIPTVPWFSFILRFEPKPKGLVRAISNLPSKLKSAKSRFEPSPVIKSDPNEITPKVLWFGYVRPLMPTMSNLPSPSTSTSLALAAELEVAPAAVSVAVEIPPVVWVFRKKEVTSAFPSAITSGFPSKSRSPTSMS